MGSHKFVREARRAALRAALKGPLPAWNTIRMHDRWNWDRLLAVLARRW